MSKVDFLCLRNLSREEIERVLARSADYKRSRKNNNEQRVLDKKAVALVFEKPSLRTRVSFEIAIQELGWVMSFLENRHVQLGKREAFLDMAKTLERYVDVLVLRTYSHSVQEKVADAISIPVINALSESFHPCQIIADLLTIKEVLGHIDGSTIAFVGDGNNIARTMLEVCTLFDVDLRLVSPRLFFPDHEFLEDIHKNLKGSLLLTESMEEALKDADIVYTDIWVSMGKEEERDLRKRIFLHYQLNSQTIKLARLTAKVMHCLPAVRGEEVTSEVLDGEHSIVFEQAENRLHTAKALLEFITQK